MPEKKTTTMQQQQAAFCGEVVITEFESPTRDAAVVQRNTLRRILGDNATAEYHRCRGLAGRTDAPGPWSTTRPSPCSHRLGQLRQAAGPSAPPRERDEAVAEVALWTARRGHGSLRGDEGELPGQPRKKKLSMAIECLMDDSDLSQPGSIMPSTNNLSVSDVCRNNAGARETFCVTCRLGSKLECVAGMPRVQIW